MPDHPRRPAGLLLDLDGTLVDTVAARIEGWVEALGELGLATTAAEVGPMIGMDGKRLAREVAATRGRALDDHEQEAVDRAAGTAFDARNRAPRVLPGAGELLAAATACGVPWVIATSSRRAQVTASVTALAGAAEGLADDPVIVDGSHVRHAKPAPDLLLLAAERLGIAPAEAWAVGDSTWDVRAAAAAGMVAVGITAGSAVDREALADAGATVVLSTLAELVRVVEEACAD